MKEPRKKWVIDYAHQDHENYVRLALHIIWNAVADLGRKDPECEQVDALEFLTMRLNDPDDLWGSIAHSAGARPLDVKEISALVRKARLTKAPPTPDSIRKALCKKKAVSR